MIVALAIISSDYYRKMKIIYAKDLNLFQNIWNR